MLLDFIKRYFAEFGQAPSLGEMASHMDISRQSAAELVGKLHREGRVIRSPGLRRGLRLPDRADEISQGDALLRLRELGWIVNNDALTLIHASIAGGEGLTTIRLPGVPELDHDPHGQVAGYQHGEEGEGGS